MKIVHILPSLAKGGAERLTLDICIELAKRSNTEVVLVVLRDDNKYTFLSELADVRLIESSVHPSLTGKTVKNVSELQSFLIEFSPDIIHSHLFESEIVLSQVDCGRAKRIVHFHDNMLQMTKPSLKSKLRKEAITNAFERKMVLKSYKKNRTEFIAISRDSFEFSKKNIPAKYKKHLLFNAINFSRFQLERKYENKLRGVIIGSLVDKKGVDLAIEVINCIKSKEKNLQLDILGDGIKRKELEILVDKLNLKEQVIFHGNVDYPEQYLAKASFYLHTAKYEPFGLVLLEAMASGLPVFSTDAYGNRDVVVNGENGFLFEERNAGVIAEAIAKTIQDEEKYLQLSQNAIQFAKSFDIEKYVDRLLEIYKPQFD